MRCIDDHVVISLRPLQVARDTGVIVTQNGIQCVFLERTADVPITVARALEGGFVPDLPEPTAITSGELGQSLRHDRKISVGFVQCREDPLAKGLIVHDAICVALLNWNRVDAQRLKEGHKILLNFRRTRRIEGASFGSNFRTALKEAFEGFVCVFKIVGPLHCESM